MSEHEEQAAFFSWLEWAFPQLYEVAFAVPNGGYRMKKTAAMLKAEGVKKGVPDVFILYRTPRWSGLVIEMKTKEGKLTYDQRGWLSRLNSQGFGVCTAYGWDEARKWVEEYMKGA